MPYLNIITSVSPIKWHENNLYLLDQRLLPNIKKDIKYSQGVDVAGAIFDMVVRGAPAIGVTAAYGVALSALQYEPDKENGIQKLKADMDVIANSRPTAINLKWAVARMAKCLGGSNINATLFFAEAEKIHKEAIADDLAMANFGDTLLTEGGVLTHCNAGALATCGVGTALGVIRAGVSSKKITKVYADETRPWLQGSRLTAWELIKDGIDTTLICEGAAASLMAKGELEWIIVGADRVAANGDVANKIGTYSLAILAKYHGVKFMVVAPMSTIDFNTATGDLIPIEQRSENELLEFKGEKLSTEKSRAWNPVFDVTPAKLITALVTNVGVVEQPNEQKIKVLLSL
jgi:methylthioribose-1-phosphate isomerase